MNLSFDRSTARGTFPPVRPGHPGSAGRPAALAITAAVVLAAALPVTAHASEALAKQSGCSVCHAMDKKLVGPSYKQVAEKYKGQADASAQLADRVRKGGKGVWGQVPMPPTDPKKVDDAAVRQLVDWILKAG